MTAPAGQAAYDSAPDPGGPDEWPAALDGMGKTWALRTLPGTLASPLVIVKVWPPAGMGLHAMATVYDADGFRALVAKMQQLADTLPGQVPDA